MDAVDPAKAYLLLESGPVVLVTTARGGVPNVMTLGFHMVIQHAPPLIGCVLGPWDHSFDALKATGECVIAVPTVDFAETVVAVGNCSGATIDKFKAFSLTAMPAAMVGAPLIAECYANIECKVVNAALVPTYNLFVLEAVGLWVDRARKERRLLHHNGDGTFTVDGAVLDLRAQMTRWRQFQVAL